MDRSLGIAEDRDYLSSHSCLLAFMPQFSAAIRNKLWTLAYGNGKNRAEEKKITRWRVGGGQPKEVKKKKKDKDVVV